MSLLVVNCWSSSPEHTTRHRWMKRRRLPSACTLEYLFRWKRSSLSREGITLWTIQCLIWREFLERKFGVQFSRARGEQALMAAAGYLCNIIRLLHALTLHLLGVTSCTSDSDFSGFPNGSLLLVLQDTFAAATWNNGTSSRRRFCVSQNRYSIKCNRTAGGGHNGCECYG